MASNIVYTTIDADYPVAGQDNDSQGFRDNFNVIKTGLNVANTELTALQDSTAKTSTDNNFLGNEIIDAELNQVTEKFYSGGLVAAPQEITFANGHYQTFRIDGDALPDSVNLTLTGWPETERYARLIIELRTENSNIDINFISSGTIKVDNSYPSTLTLDSDANPKIVEFWTYDAGTTIFAKYLGQFA